MRSSTRDNSMNRHSRHNTYPKPQRYNTYPQNRPYPHSSSSNRNPQHSHRSAHDHSSHNTHSSYDHSIRSSNHNHSQQRRHSSLHSMNVNGNANRNTHNLPSHSNRSHHNTSVSTSHRPHSNHSNHNHSQNRSRNIRHSVHRTSSNRNSTSLHQNDKVRRSRNIRNITTSHSSSSVSPSKERHSQSASSLSISPSKQIQSDCIHSETSTNVLETTMNALSFESVPYKYDYHSKINMSLESAKHDTERIKFHLSGDMIREWRLETETEKKHNVREHMLSCLRLINNLIAMDESTEFVFSPCDPAMNTEFYAVFEAIKGENMWFLKVKNLILSDVYESVDHFASDVRLIFRNTFCVFESDHEWSKNARRLQSVFEEGLIVICRQIENAERMFICNGNPGKDRKQIEFMNLSENKIFIEREKARNKASRLAETKAGMCGEGLMGKEEKEGLMIIDEKEQKKRERNEYLANIDRSNHNKRRRASKQKLKMNNVVAVAHEAEEGEIVNICALNDAQLDETDVWFEFIAEYRYYSDICRVIMIQETFVNETQFEEYKMRLESIGSDLSLDIKDKSADIQCKIYEILECAKNGIMKTEASSSGILRELMNNKKNIKKRRKCKKTIMDPYSNEAMQMKHEKARKEKEKEQGKEREKEKEKTKEIEVMATDQDSDASFDDNLYFGHDIHIANEIDDIIHSNNSNNHNNIIEKQLLFPSEVNGGYRPIRPTNVDEDDNDNSKWNEYNYTKQQQEDDEEIEF